MKKVKKGDYFPTIIAPIELNFLLFVNKIYNKTWYSVISKEEFIDDFENHLLILWDKRVEALINDGKYIINERVIKEDIERLVRKKETAEIIIKEFENFWYRIPPYGFGSLLERICGTLQVSQIQNLIGDEYSKILFIVFDCLPKEYRAQNSVKVVPYSEFLRYI
ncbi:hypothetical protein NSQ14_01760 [Caldifermentibacillus hisashii]|jgi:hypothetical protein|uniref:hypothetical protein n=1 Tax=Bacillaceae TaxID=186817 RepID=UPI002041F51B|nr:hypothetical protein [Caldibacillus thermoamylovorans]MCM3477881.1 hypothetical protein [Caldibacillus thermoamylovorans]